VIIAPPNRWIVEEMKLEDHYKMKNQDLIDIKNRDRKMVEDINIISRNKERNIQKVEVVKTGAVDHDQEVITKEIIIGNAIRDE